MIREKDFLRQSDARFVLLGIPEDIGVRANLGQAGADTGWLAFLQSFLNMQSNDFLDGHEMMLLGHFDFGDTLFSQYLSDRAGKCSFQQLYQSEPFLSRAGCVHRLCINVFLQFCPGSPGSEFNV